MNEKNDMRGIYDHYYRGSDKICIKTYFDKYKQLLKTSDLYKDHEFKSKTLMSIIGNSIDEEKYNLLEEYCNIGNLTVDGELEKMTKISYELHKNDPSITENLQLQTVKLTKKRNALKTHQIYLKYRSEKPIIYEKVSETKQDKFLKPKDDILIYVRVYVPFTSRHKQSIGTLGKLSVNFVIVMHGSQTLDKLRDLITCSSDHSISKEMSEAPVPTKTPNAKDVYKSGFFFIENTFYNDFRDPNNKDNSIVIREWAETKNFGTYKTAKMEETRIDSLTLRFGYPWVYQHQGDCEHLISFSDARLVNFTDELNTDCYPRIVRIKPRPNRYCMTCGIYNVNWVTTSNNRLPHNPCLFCDNCFKSYNYINGKKVGSFKAYPYPYDSNFEQIQIRQTKRIKPTSSQSSKKESQSDQSKSFKAKMLKMDTS